jgi:Tfp pilus assembly protein PilF
MVSPTSTPDYDMAAEREGYRHQLILVIILLATLGAYARSFWDDFTYDDRIYVMVPNSDNQPNFMVGEIQPLGLYFQRHYGHGCVEVGRGYRPVTVLSFAVVHALFGQPGAGPEGSDCPSGPHHVVNVLLHLLAVLLTYRIVALFTGTGVPALLAAAVFGLHALRSDPVISIVGRAEILGYVCGVGALLLYVSGLHRSGLWRYLRLVLSGLLLFCACSSKESAFAFVVFVPLFTLTLDCHRGSGLPLVAAMTQSLRRQVPGLLVAVVVPFAVSLAMYLYLQGLLPDQEFEAAGSQNPIFAAPWLVRVLTGVMVLGYGLYAVFVPLQLACDYGIGVFTPVASIFDLRFLAAVLVLAAILVFGLRRFRRHPLLFLAMASFLGFTFLTSNIPLPVETIFGERLYYTPAVAVSFLVAWGARRLAGSRQWLMVLVLAVSAWCAVGGYLIFRRCQAWQDNATLFATDAEGQPHSLAMRMAVARSLRLQGQAAGWKHEDTKKRWYQNLERAYQIEPRSPLVLNMLAYYHLEFGELDEAEKYVHAALESPLYNARQDGMKLYWQLSKIAEDRGNLKLAEQHLQAAIDIDPQRVEPQTQLADFWYRNGRRPEAEALLDTVLQRVDENLHVRWLLIRLARARGERQRVGQLLEAGVRVRPDEAGFALELGLMYLEDRRLEAAAAMLAQALRGRLDPAERRRGMLPLANCLAVLGRRHEAVQVLEKVLADPQLHPRGRARVQQRIRELEGR